ncbi:hypothetical protein D3C73_751960 [compost metagenome]
MQVHLADLVDPPTDPVQRLGSTSGLIDAALHLLTALLHREHGIARTVLQRVDHALDLVGRLLGALGQAAYLIGDHRKPAPGISGARGLDGGIECQQIGLLGNAADDLQHPGDLAAMPFQLMNDCGGVRQLIGQAHYGLTTFTDQLMAFQGLAAGHIGGHGGLLCMAGDLGDAGGHLVDRRRNVIGFRLLIQCAAMTALQVLNQLRRMPRQALRGIADAPHHCTDLGFEHLQGELDLPELIPATGVNALAQRVIDNLPGALAQGHQRTQHPPGTGRHQRAAADQGQ